MTKASQWRAHVEGWRASGKTAPVYCAEHGLKVASLRYWSSRIRAEERGASNGDGREPPFARVRTESRGGTAPDALFRMHAGALRVDVLAELDTASLRRLFEAMRELAEVSR